jgi:hypothetical protein
MPRRADAERGARRNTKARGGKSGSAKLPVRPTRQGARRDGGSTGSARGNWIDAVDRVAQRPFLEGDYLPGTKGARKRART